MAFRVVISKNVEELLKLAKAVLKKHQALGKDSPLNMLPWGKVGPSIDKAIAVTKKYPLSKISCKEAETCSKVFTATR